ncbi:beta-1,3-galactosyltransferase 5-like isoform X2 [Saccostrea echinata]|uniref:beta-1,3-galactosyltransferase 5-like isoform X2 n=1 Tax=Saccostrea echinata TaxID=191078 RepID=UPI002A834AFD|nr:beta-1,3-galactosyltransferase 5-like isoform X2 [Saccostrea echinata]
MRKHSSYLKFVSLSCLVMFTLLYLTMDNENIHVYYEGTGDRLTLLEPMYDINQESKTGIRIIKTKTKYPVGMYAPYLINNRNLCRQYDKISALVMVHTSVGNFWRRKEMRRTWLNISHYSPENLRVIFLVGTTSIKTIQKKLEKENSLYNDIIQGEFVDSYRNLTNKGVMGYRWITENCMNAEIVIKIDDDSFINFFKFFEDFSFLKERKRSIFCNKINPNSMPIIRKNSSKWFVSDIFYKAQNTYPHTYCSGFVVFISTDLIPALYQAVFTAPFFWVDDFYLFGLLPSRVKNVVHENFGGNLTFMHPEGLKCYKELRRECKYLVMPARDKEIDLMWKAVIADRRQSVYGNYYMKVKSFYR